MKSHKHSTVNTSVPVVLIRHAQSQWNQENRFTGWANPSLTAAGIAEAEKAGQWLRNNAYQFDVAYSSRLQRAITTLDILLAKSGQSDIPRYQNWRLNERHYGALQGVDKAVATAEVVCIRSGAGAVVMQTVPRHCDAPTNSSGE